MNINAGTFLWMWWLVSCHYGVILSTNVRYFIHAFLNSDTIMFAKLHLLKSCENFFLKKSRGNGAKLFICNNVINKFFCNWTQLFSGLFVGNKEIVSVDRHLILIVNQSISREWNMFTSTMQWRFYIPVSDLIFFMESITEIPEQENGDLSFCSYSSIIEKCSIYIPVNIIICYKQFWLQPWKYHFCKVTWLLNLHWHF